MNLKVLIGLNNLLLDLFNETVYLILDVLPMLLHFYMETKHS